MLVSASAVGIYGDRGDEILTEASSTLDAPRDFLTELGREWEAATEPARAAGIRVVLLRFGIVLTPAGGVLGRMLPPFRLGVGGPLGSGRQCMSWIAIDDLLGAVHYALMTDALAGPVNVTAPSPGHRSHLRRRAGPGARPARPAPGPCTGAPAGVRGDGRRRDPLQCPGAAGAASGVGVPRSATPIWRRLPLFCWVGPRGRELAQDDSPPRTPYLTRMTLPRAVVLLSGGMDSTTTAAIARREGFDVHALSVRYGQRHAVELEAARRVAERLGIRRHVIVDLDLRAFGGSALTADMPVPKDTPLAEIGARIPATYVPARNTIFLSLALAWAETLGARDIFLGANALDYSGYPDCRPEYLEAFARMANLATRAGVRRVRGSRSTRR